MPKLFETPRYERNLRRIRHIRAESGGNDAETLARLFEDREIRDDGSLGGRIDALLEATEHRWLPRIHTPLDVPGLYEVRGFSHNGFRPEFEDPWPGSRDQVGHLLTAFALAVRPETVDARRLAVRVRDLVGAPRGMPRTEVALRLTIGHEKRPDPGRHDPLILLKLRRQFASATDDDVASFVAAVERVVDGAPGGDLAAAPGPLTSIHVGSGTGNSRQDLRLSIAAYVLAELVTTGRLAAGADVAAWIRRNLKAEEG